MAGNIKKSVVDASFILAYLFPQERTLEVEKILMECQSKQRQLFSSKLLPFEVLNGIKYFLVRKGFSREKAEEMVKLFFDFDIQYEETNFQKAFAVAVENNLTVYDASYLQIALNKNCSLLTLDEKLRKSAKVLHSF